ncbi:uncharacterized protein LOC118767710 [Octopus sinensis]|uniref:Uncharacterized protein LOC118767710 n=1 Tax=Octopus sinensis TaxID=2607531 RepID=A0A7E6FLL6_9MOLL|nr:uncharacterized protein LOC118767710 [Octopus sinensis]
MLKFIVLVAICIVGANAACTMDGILGCIPKVHFTPHPTNAQICNAIGKADKCIAGIGCDMSLADKLFAKLCGPKTSCDIKQAVKCIYLASPAAPAGYHMLQGVVRDFKTCMVGAGCKNSAGKISNQICATV